MTSNNSSCEDIVRHIGLAMGVARSLQTISKASNFPSDTKLLLYRSISRSILLFNAESWYVKEKDKRKLRIFEMSVLRRTFGFSLTERRHNQSMREGLGMDADIVQLVQQRRLMSFEHIIRMDQRRLPYILMYGRMHGTRPRERPNKRWLDNITDDCAEMEMTTTSATRLAIDRSRWTIAVARLLERTDPSVSS